MGTLISALILLGLAAVFAIAIGTRKRRASAEWPVNARRVLTAPEQLLYHRLRAAFPELVVFGQVALSQLVEVRYVKGHHAVFNRISRLVADFVVCAADFRAIAVIELDDRSHQNERRADADRRKTAALEAAGIPLHRFNVKSLPSVEEIRNQVQPPVATSRGRRSAMSPPPITF